jgi:acyl-CoA synthetase (AMP-forming)/AMP-acid ligase II
MSEDVQPKPVKTTPLMRRVILHAALLLGVFLLGFVPMWLKARECSTNLSEAGHQLNLARIQNTLASAAIDARRGEYEAARQAASSFFTSLRAETDRGDASTLSQAQREGVQPLFARRDEFITLLARSDPASADRLSDLYVSYRKTMNR